MISLLGIIFGSASEQGVFASSPTDEPYVNYTIFNSNWTIDKKETVQPPICEPVIPDVNIPLLDDIGCLGAVIGWMNGIRGIQSTNIWFVVIFVIPVSVIVAIAILRFIRGN